jgi:predicted DNA-binding transcriptional regulator YafY
MQTILPVDIRCLKFARLWMASYQERALSRSARLLALLQALRCRRRPVTAAALARELQVSERTIYRDLSELASQGAPVQGEAGVGYMLRPGLFLPPLMLTEDETEAVLLGLRYVDQRGDDVLTKAAANAHAKILAVLPQEGQIAATLPMTIPGPKTHGFPENKVPLNALRLAIQTCRRLAIDYVNGEGRQTQRVIWPIQLGFMDNARVVTGWCELRQAFRFFRTDRISSAEIGDRYPARRADLVRDFHSQVRDEDSTDKSPDRN